MPSPGTNRTILAVLTISLLIFADSSPQESCIWLYWTFFCASQYPRTAWYGFQVWFTVDNISDAGGECYATRGRSWLGDVLEHQPTTCCGHPLIAGFPIYSGEPGHPAGHKRPSCMLRGQATPLREPLSLRSAYNFPSTRLVTAFQHPYPIFSSYVWQINPTDVLEKSWKCCIGRLWHIFHCHEASMFVNLATHCFVFTSANFSIMCTMYHVYQPS